MTRNDEQHAKTTTIEAPAPAESCRAEQELDLLQRHPPTSTVRHPADPPRAPNLAHALIWIERETRSLPHAHVFVEQAMGLYTALLAAHAEAPEREAWPLGAQVLYTGPRPELSRTAPWTVIESQHAHLTRITRDGIGTSVPHDCLRALAVSAQLHALAVEASRSDSTSSAVRHARDELVRVCLSLGGES